MKFIEECGMLAHHNYVPNDAGSGSLETYPDVIHYSHVCWHGGFKFAFGYRENNPIISYGLYEFSTGAAAVLPWEVPSKKPEDFYSKLLEKFKLHNVTIENLVSTYCYNELDLPLWKKTLLM